MPRALSDGDRKIDKRCGSVGRSHLGWKVTIVSITVDPEHDGPAKLREYAQEQGADKKGWYFLTGSAADVDRALAGFKMFREKGPDGSGRPPGRHDPCWSRREGDARI